MPRAVSLCLCSRSPEKMRGRKHTVWAISVNWGAGNVCLLLCLQAKSDSQTKHRQPLTPVCRMHSAPVPLFFLLPFIWCSTQNSYLISKIQKNPSGESNKLCSQCKAGSWTLFRGLVTYCTVYGRCGCLRNYCTLCFWSVSLKHPRIFNV